MNKGDLVNKIATGADITKASAGRALDSIESSDFQVKNLFNVITRTD